MHEMIMRIPNILFYNNQIQSSYIYSVRNMFIHKERPMLFINSPAKESSYGESYINKNDCEDDCLKKIAEELRAERNSIIRESN